MSAAESVWALVSGLPPGPRERRLIMVLQAFFDDSKSDGQVLILAGYVANATSWAEFSKEWQKLLDGPPPWKRFKMTAIQHWRLDPEYDRVKRHYEVIKKHVLLDVCIAVPIPELEKVCDEFGFSKEDRNPYFLAWNCLVSMYAQHASKFGIAEPVELFFDEQSEKMKVLAAWDHLSRVMPRRWARLIRNMPSFKNDDELLPLQAADFVAWWKRRDFRENDTVRRAWPLVPWETENAPFHHLYGEVREDGIRKTAAKAVKILKGEASPALRLPSYDDDWKWSL